MRKMTVSEATERFEKLGFEVGKNRNRYRVFAFKAEQLWPNVITLVDTNPMGDYGDWELRVNGQWVRGGGLNAKELIELLAKIESAIIASLVKKESK